jgi:hypothetical protein
MSRDDLQVLHRKLNRVTKWRKLFAGWQLGTRSDKDPEAAAVRDHRELSILVRVEASALVGLLRKKGVITEAEWIDAVGAEADMLNADYAKRFPGVTAHEYGLLMNPKEIEEAGWMKDWKP